MENKEHVHCLIIGSGPAGYSAAIYTARANLKPVLYQGIQPGGQLTITTEVENYPGYPNGVQGPEMMVEFEKQATRMGADIRFGLATKVDFSGQPFKVWIDEEKLITADSVIIATGASAKWLGLPSEERLNGYGVSACAVCDGFFFKGKEVAIVGAGDTAAEEALYLSKLCTNVHMFIRRSASGNLLISKYTGIQQWKKFSVREKWWACVLKIRPAVKLKPLMCMDFLWPSVMSRIPAYSKNGWIWMKPGISKPFRVLQKQILKVFLLRAMCRTGFTVRL
jgi:cation diffusion facilitator CzcD-associated flavoprotein CzcO